MRHFGLWFAVLAMLMSTLGCRRIYRYAPGQVNELVVITHDSTFLARIQQTVNEVFYTPQVESLFVVIVPPDSLIPRYLKHKNVLVVAYPGSPDWEVYRQVFGERTGVHLASGRYAVDDHIIGIAGPKWEATLALLEQHLPRIKDSLMAWMYRNYLQREYFAGHNPQIRDILRERWHIEIDVPSGWAFFVQQDSLFALAKHYPDRFFFVYQEPAPRTLDPWALLDLRDAITRVYYDGDFVLRDTATLRFTHQEFLGQQATVIYGVWQNNRRVLGGPFKLIAFNYRNRFFVVDIGVFAPDLDHKMPFIFRTEAFLRNMKVLD